MHSAENEPRQVVVELLMCASVLGMEAAPATRA
jgi:hypothetical protein